MRLCIFGNSHAGAWKLAWDKLAPTVGEVDIHFFAAPGGLLKSLEAVDGKLVANRPKLQNYFKTTAGAESIDPGDYDAFCILACRATPFYLLKLYRGHRTESHKLSEDCELVSDACFDAAAAGMTAKCFAFDIQRHIESVTTKPIYLVPQPMPSEAILHDPSEAMWRKAHDAGDEAALAESFFRVLTTLGMGRLRLVRQPKSTLQSPLFTCERFAKGSFRLKDPSEEHPEDDYAHMNAEFGALALRDFIHIAADNLKPASLHTPAHQSSVRGAA